MQASGFLFEIYICLKRKLELSGRNQLNRMAKPHLIFKITFDFNHIGMNTNINILSLHTRQ